MACFCGLILARTSGFWARDSQRGVHAKAMASSSVMDLISVFDEGESEEKSSAGSNKTWDLGVLNENPKPRANKRKCFSIVVR